MKEQYFVKEKVYVVWLTKTNPVSRYNNTMFCSTVYKDIMKRDPSSQERPACYHWRFGFWEL